jgi:hypothetical protein
MCLIFISINDCGTKKTSDGLFLMKGTLQMRKDDENEREKLTAEQAVKMLKKENVEITLDQAGLILEFLRKLANLTISNYLNQKDEKDSRPICESEYGRTGGQGVFPKKSRRNARKVL